jgi:uncharacterized protein
LDRLFLDANILFSAAYRADTGLLQFWKLKNVTLCSSRHALEEARMNLTEAAQKRRLAKLTRKIKFFDPIPGEFPAEISLPEKDEPILIAAMGARATHLITGDIRHFGPYFGRKIKGILVLSPSDYLWKQRQR